MNDKGFPGLVIKIELQGNKLIVDGKDTLLVAGAGEEWDKVVALAASKKLYGIENLSAIPGTVGAAPVQNIGAYGTDLSETLEWVEVFNCESMSLERILTKECKLGYRDSIFKHDKEKNLIITRVALRLKKEGTINIEYKDVKNYFKEKRIKNITPQHVRDAVVLIREAKLPNPKEIGTVGSFFKNPIITNELLGILRNIYPYLPAYPIDSRRVKIPLAWVLDEVCGFKGLRKGAVGLYKNQPLALVHFGGGSAEEIEKFADTISKKVTEKIQLKIEREVSYV